MVVIKNKSQIYTFLLSELTDDFEIPEGWRCVNEILVRKGDDFGITSFLKIGYGYAILNTDLPEPAICIGVFEPCEIELGKWQRLKNWWQHGKKEKAKQN